MKFVKTLEEICKKCIAIHMDREEKYGSMRSVLHPIAFASVIDIKAKRLFNLLLDYDSSKMDDVDDQVYDIINYLVFLHDRIRKFGDENDEEES